MDPCSCCYGELLVLSRTLGAAMCLSHTHTHAKIIGVWKIQSCWISTMFWHFHLKGHNWLSARICDAAGGGEIIKKAKQCRGAKPLKTDRADPLCHLSRSHPFYSASLLSYRCGGSQREDQGPIIVKLNPTMGVWLWATSPPSFQCGGHDAHLKLRRCLWCDPGTGSFHPVGSVFQWRQSQKRKLK